MGFGDYLDDLGAFVVGDRDASLLDRTQDIFAKSLQVGSMFGMKGDIADIQGAVTGFDPLFGMKLNPIERWLGVLGPGMMGAGVLGGARMAKLGLPAYGLLSQGRRYYDTDVFEVTDYGRLAKGNKSLDMALARLNEDQPLGNPDITFILTQQKTNDILKLDYNQDFSKGMESVGWEKLASDLGATVGGDWDEAAQVWRGDGVGNTAGYLEGILAPLIDEMLPSSVAYTNQQMKKGVMDPNARLKEVAFGLSQWEFARDWPNFEFRGETAQNALAEWEKLLSGADANTELLASAQAKFMVAFDWLQHPELLINPLMAVNHINLDGPSASVGLKVLQWHQGSLDTITGRAVQERVRAMMGMHPANLVAPMAENLKSLFNQTMQIPNGMTPEEWMTDMQHLPSGLKTISGAEAIKNWRDWYIQARKDLTNKAKQLRRKVKGREVSRSGGKAPSRLGEAGGISPHFATDEQATVWLTVVASLASASEDWSTNVDKAVAVADYLNGPRRGETFAEIHAAINKTLGHKMPESDLVKIILLDGLDDPMTVFRTGAKGVVGDEGLDTAQMIEAIDRGEDLRELAPLRKLPFAWVSQKQDSFAYAIMRSLEHELEERAWYMADLMGGELGARLDYTHGGSPRVHTGTSVREKLPLVADRQHFKAALGFSLVPDTWYASDAYDQFAQAGRVAAAALGEVDGRVVLPEELQAVSWMRYRAMSHYTDPFGRNWPMTPANFQKKLKALRDPTKRLPKTKTEPSRVVSKEPEELARDIAKAEQLELEFTKAGGTFTATGKPEMPPENEYIRLSLGEDGRDLVAYDKKELGMTAGARRPVSRNATWADGHGPELNFSNNILKYVTGESVPPVPTNRMVDADTDLRRYVAPPESLRPIDANVGPEDYEELIYEMAPDNTMKVLGEPGVQPRRRFYPTSAIHNGKQVRIPVEPVRVKDNSEEFQALLAASRRMNDPNKRALTGIQLHPDSRDKSRMAFFQEGPMMSFSVRTNYRDNQASSYLGLKSAPPASTPYRDPTLAEPSLFREDSLMPTSLNPLPVENGLDSISGFTSGKVVQRMVNHLRQLGIEVDIEELSPHMGMSPMWELGFNKSRTWSFPEARRALGKRAIKEMIIDAEPRREVVMKFASNEDLRLAARYLGSSVDPTQGEFPSRVVRSVMDYMGRHFPDRNYRRANPQRFHDAAALRDREFGIEAAAEWYMSLPPGRSKDPEVLASYRALREEIIHQANYIEQELGIRMEVSAKDPYASPAELIRDVEENGVLKVFGTKEGESSFFTVDENNMFRFVHDFFGHMVNESDFGRYGEEVAFMSHMQMFSDKAQGALFTELRAQTAALLAAGDFQEQRMGLPPPEVLRWYRDSWDDWAEDTWIRRITRDEVADVRFYVDHPNDAPPGTIGMWESVYEDGNGQIMSNVNPGGGPNRPNMSQVWVLEDDMGAYLSDSRSGRLDPGGFGEHVFKDNVYDNRIVFVTQPDVQLVGNGKNIWGTTIKTPDPDTPSRWSRKKGWVKKYKTSHVKEFWLEVPPWGSNDLPRAALDEADLLHGMGADPSRIVKITKGSVSVRPAADSGTVNRTGFDIWLPDTGNGNVEEIMFDQVRHLLSETNDGGAVAQAKVLRRT